MFHEQVQKEIGRRRDLEKEKEQRTTANLREGLGFPTTLPEMVAQQATATDFFDISMDPPSVVVEEPMEVEAETPAPMQTVEV